MWLLLILVAIIICFLYFFLVDLAKKKEVELKKKAKSNLNTSIHKTISKPVSTVTPSKSVSPQPSKAVSNTVSVQSLSANAKSAGRSALPPDGHIPQIPDSVLGCYKSPSGGYINYATFQVSGLYPQTKRRRKRTYSALDEAGAIQQARADGLTDPFDITIIPSDAPSESQLNYAKNLGAYIPEDACKADVTSILCRLLDDGDMTPVKSDFASYAFKHGIQFSRYSGTAQIFRCAKRCLPSDAYRSFVWSSKAYFESSSHKLIRCTNDKAQKSIDRLSPCDVVNFESSGDDVSAWCKTQAFEPEDEIGALPKAVAQRYLQNGAVAAFVDHIEYDADKDKNIPYVMIYWK